MWGCALSYKGHTFYFNFFSIFFFFFITLTVFLRLSQYFSEFTIIPLGQINQNDASSIPKISFSIFLLLIIEFKMLLFMKIWCAFTVEISFLSLKYNKQFGVSFAVTIKSNESSLYIFKQSRIFR